MANNSNQRKSSNNDAAKPARQNGNSQPTDTAPPAEADTVVRGFQDTFMDERNDVLTVINELEDQLDQQQEARERLERDLANRDAELQTARQRAQELEWHSVTLQTRIDNLEQMRQEVTALEEELEDANARHHRDQEQLSQRDKEVTRLNGELKAANKQLEELWAIRKERDGLRGDLKSVRARLETFERDYQDVSDARIALQDKLRETELNLEEARKGRSQLELEVRDARNAVGELQRIQTELEDKVESLRSDKKNMQAQITHLERENSRLLEQRQFFEGELISLRNMNRNSENALTNLKKAFAEVRVALSETKSRVRRRVVTPPRTRVMNEHDVGTLSDEHIESASLDTATVVHRNGEGKDVTPAGSPSSAETVTEEHVSAD